MNDSRLRGLLRLKHLREVTEAVGEDMAIEGERFDRLARIVGKPRVISSFNLFQTPTPLAVRLARLAGIEQRHRILEPSAGLGRLYHAIRDEAPDNNIVMVEISPDCCGELYRITESDTACELIQADFMGLPVDRLGQFDRIVMNPPFRMGTDVRHVLHAVKFLKAGGRLLSIVANGPKQRSALKPLASEWIDLPSGSFKSEGTSVETAIVVINA